MISADVKNIGIAKLILGLAAVFGLFQWIAAALESFRGEYGLVVAVVVVAATLVVQRLFFDEDFAEAVRSIGLLSPKIRSIAVAIAISVGMILAIPLYSYATATTFTLLPGWPLLFVGMFFQAGVAEETLFRGYLYGYFRRTHSFWRSAALSAIPFVLVHFFIFFTMDWMIAAASVALAVVTSFPLARLFDLGGGTIWAPAILHFTIQAGIKLFDIHGDAANVFLFVWMVVCALIPYAVFLRVPANSVK